MRERQSSVRFPGFHSPLDEMELGEVVPEEVGVSEGVEGNVLFDFLEIIDVELDRKRGTCLMKL